MPSLSLPFPGAGFLGDAEACSQLENKVFPSYIPQCRWFGGKARKPRAFAIEESLAIGPHGARLLLVRVEYGEGAAETYVLPLEVTTTRDTAGAIAHFNDGA